MFLDTTSLLNLIRFSRQICVNYLFIFWKVIDFASKPLGGSFHLTGSHGSHNNRCYNPGNPQLKSPHWTLHVSPVLKNWFLCKTDSFSNRINDEQSSQKSHPTFLHSKFMFHRCIFLHNWSAFLLNLTIRLQPQVHFQEMLILCITYWRLWSGLE